MAFSDTFAIARNIFRTAPTGGAIDPKAVDRDGSAVNLTLAASSQVFAEVDSRQAARLAALLVSTARDGDLDRIISERTKGTLPRVEAAPSSIAVNLSRTGVLGGTIDAGDPNAALLVGGILFSLDSPVIFVPGDIGPIQAFYTATTLGSAGNLAPEDIQGLKTPTGLFDVTITAAAIALDSTGYATGGNERENNDAYRARYVLWEAGLVRNVDFLAAGALGVAGIAYAVSVEELTSSGDPLGTATLYVGDNEGRANAALVARVRSKLMEFRLVGQHVEIVGTVPELVSIVGHFAVVSGYDQNSVLSEVRAALVAFVNSTKPGATLTVASLTAVIQAVAGVAIEAGTPTGLISPVADVAPAAASTTFRTSGELVTFA